jgi:hypothetical protein
MVAGLIPGSGCESLPVSGGRRPAGKHRSLLTSLLRSSFPANRRAPPPLRSVRLPSAQPPGTGRRAATPPHRSGVLGRWAGHRCARSIDGSACVCTYASFVSRTSILLQGARNSYSRVRLDILHSGPERRAPRYARAACPVAGSKDFAGGVAYAPAAVGGGEDCVRSAADVRHLHLGPVGRLGGA